MTESTKTARQARMLINRVRKKRRALRPYLKRNDITCYRVYDRDIPEIPLIVDWYEGRLVVWLHGDPHHIVDPDGWLRAMGEALRSAFEVDTPQLFLKQRRRAQGGTQYGAKGRLEALETVHEGGLSFLVNLEDYVDTGLFLDHRTTRGMVRGMSRDKAVLNLFAYTGAFSVYAADGGAGAVTTVDLSNTYLDWARQNMRLNGFTGEAYRFVRDDVLSALAERRVDGKYDIIVLDPPTVSKSKRMLRSFDVQHDHGLLINRLLERLNRGGAIIFSTNYSKFRLSDDIDADIREITPKTCPEDFKARPAHRCWRITHP